MGEGDGGQMCTCICGVIAVYSYIKGLGCVPQEIFCLVHACVCVCVRTHVCLCVFMCVCVFGIGIE